MNTLPPLETRPKEIATVLGLLWASLAIGVVRTIVDWQHVEAITNSVAFAVVTIVLTFVITAFLIWKIGQGRNWARIVLLVLFLLGVIPFIFVVRSDFQRSPVVAIISVVQALLQAIAFWLVFTPPGSSWFQTRQRG